MVPPGASNAQRLMRARQPHVTVITPGAGLSRFRRRAPITSGGTATPQIWPQAAISHSSLVGSGESRATTAPEVIPWIYLIESLVNDRVNIKLTSDNIVTRLGILREPHE